MKRFVKKMLCAVGLALACNQLSAQSLDQAKKLYNEGEYAEAKPAFEKLVKQSPRTHLTACGMAFAVMKPAT